MQQDLNPFIEWELKENLKESMAKLHGIMGLKVYLLTLSIKCLQRMLTNILTLVL